MRKHVKWTPEEDNILKDNCGVKTIKQIREQLLPNRTTGAISARIHNLGLGTAPHSKKPKNPAWTSNEDDIIRDNYTTKTVADIQKLMPYRTQQAIQQRISRVGMTKRPQQHRQAYKRWSAAEIQLLQQHYTNITPRELQAQFFPDRTVTAIKSQAEKLHLYRGKGDLWSEEEEKIIKQYYDTMKPAEFRKKHMPGRPIAQIYSKAARLRATAKQLPED